MIISKRDKHDIEMLLFRQYRSELFIINQMDFFGTWEELINSMWTADKIATFLIRNINLLIKDYRTEGYNYLEYLDFLVNEYFITDFGYVYNRLEGKYDIEDDDLDFYLQKLTKELTNRMKEAYKRVKVKIELWGVEGVQRLYD